MVAAGEIELNAGRPTVTLEVTNTGDRPVQVGSHYHFYETNAALAFDRDRARGCRLDIPAGTAVRVTGIDQLTAHGAPSPGGEVVNLTLVGALGALLVLLVVFGSLLAFAPLLVAAVAILATLLLVGVLTTVTEVNLIVEYLVALIGLGVAIDYSLLLVTRWREERAHGHPGDEAVHRAMATAGRSVLLSGSTVAIGLLALVVLPVSFLRSVGYAGVLIPLVSALVSITLLPVVLAGAGRRLDWPRLRLRREATSSRAWTAWARAGWCVPAGPRRCWR